MHTLIYILVAVVVLVLLFFIWGVIRLRKGNYQAIEAIRRVRISDLPGLVAEGKDGLTRAYIRSLDFNDAEAAAKLLDSLFADQRKLKDTFQKEGFYWRFVLPVGALIGEYIRIHAKGVWKETPEGLCMEIPVKDGTATCHPFDKVLKQVGQAEKGDLYAYLLSSTQLSSVQG
jgi:Negative regulator of septation ring formation